MNVEELKRLVEERYAGSGEVQQKAKRSKSVKQKQNVEDSGSVQLNREELEALLSNMQQSVSVQSAVQPQVQQPVQGLVDISQEPEKKGIFSRFRKDDDADRIYSRPTILYYDTDNTCKLVTSSIRKDGSVVIDDRLFDFSGGQPDILTMKGKGGRFVSYPFYIVKHDNMKPIDIDEYPDSKPTPDEASRLVELQTLKTLAQIEGGKMKKGPLIILMAAAFFTGVVVKMVLGLAGVW